MTLLMKKVSLAGSVAVGVSLAITLGVSTPAHAQFAAQSNNFSNTFGATANPNAFANFNPDTPQQTFCTAAQARSNLTNNFGPPNCIVTAVGSQATRNNQFSGGQNLFGQPGAFGTSNFNTGFNNTGFNNTAGFNNSFAQPGAFGTSNFNTGFNTNTGFNNTGFNNTGFNNTGFNNSGFNNTGPSGGISQFGQPSFNNFGNQGFGQSSFDAFGNPQFGQSGFNSFGTQQFVGQPSFNTFGNQQFGHNGANPGLLGANGAIGGFNRFGSAPYAQQGGHQSQPNYSSNIGFGSPQFGSPQFGGQHGNLTQPYLSNNSGFSGTQLDGRHSHQTQPNYSNNFGNNTPYNQQGGHRTQPNYSNNFGNNTPYNQQGSHQTQPNYSNNSYSMPYSRLGGRQVQSGYFSKSSGYGMMPYSQRGQNQRRSGYDRGFNDGFSRNSFTGNDFFSGNGVSRNGFSRNSFTGSDFFSGNGFSGAAPYARQDFRQQRLGQRPHLNSNRRDNRLGRRIGFSSDDSGPVYIDARNSVFNVSLEDDRFGGRGGFGLGQGITHGPSIRTGITNSTPNVIAEVQQSLATLGFDPGPVDGRFGMYTRDGILAYQRARGLRADGRLTSRLIQTLRRDVQRTISPAVDFTPVALNGPLTGNFVRHREFGGMADHGSPTFRQSGRTPHGLSRFSDFGQFDDFGSSSLDPFYGDSALFGGISRLPSQDRGFFQGRSRLFDDGFGLRSSNLRRSGNVADAQDMLASLGLNPGASDGIAGPATINAIADYQRHKGLYPDGRLTQSLLRSMRNDLQVTNRGHLNTL